MILSMPMWISLVLLCLLSSVHATFTGVTCSGANFCVQRTPSGTVCTYSNISAFAWTCTPPYKLPLEAHLNQTYSIGHYSASGEHLGGWNFSLPVPATPANPIYLCMSARVNITSAHYVTLCAEVLRDNSWQPTRCFVNVVPANVADRCYTGPTTTVTTSLTTIPATDSDQPKAQATSRSTITPSSTDVPPTDPSPSSSTSIKRSLLKDIGYSVIWAPILIFLTVAF